MATKRMVSSSLPNSKKMRKLKDDTTRLLFYVLCVRCDDDGKMDADPEDLRADYFGGRDKIKIQNVDYMLTDLAMNDLIVYYEDKNTSVKMLSIPKWKKYNKISKDRYQPSEIPCYSKDNHNLLPECLQNVNKMSHSIEENRVVKSSIEEKSKPSLSQTSLTLSKKFLNCILEENEKSKFSHMDCLSLDKQELKWAEDIDKMIRIDKRTENDIEKVIVFATSDSFWKGNILSASKLRKQFDQLYVKMQTPKKESEYV